MKSLVLFFLITSVIRAEQGPAFTRTVNPHRITVFVKPFQEVVADAGYHLKRFDKKTKTPGKINRTILKQQLERIRAIGLCVVYNGFCTVSDMNGEITFPRATQQDEVEYVIAQRIRPVILKGATVHHFVVPPSADVAYYQLKRNENEEENYFYWETTKKPVPDHRRVEANMMVFFAKPEQLVIQEELVVTTGEQNLFLPDIFVKNTVASHALLFLKVSKYFSPVKFVYQYTDDRYATIIKPYFAG